MTGRGYEQDLSIDQARLDKEWLEQPRKFYQYAEALADARYGLDKAKENLDVVKANLDNKIRKDPNAFGLDGKVTEGAISGAIVLHADYTEAKNLVLEASHTVEVLTGAVRAFDQRKSALENLVRLHGQQYFAVPAAENLPPEAREHMQQVERQDSTQRQRRRMNPPAE